MPEITEYTLTQLKHLYMEANPGASASKARRAAQTEWKKRQNNPSLINGLRNMHDPTPAEAIANIEINDHAAAIRLGLEPKEAA